MNLDDIIKVVGALGGFAVAVWGGVWTYLRAKAAARATPFEIMERRLVNLEAADEKKQGRIEAQDERIERLVQADRRKGLEIIHLRNEAGVLGEHAIAIHSWIDAGMPPPPPTMTEAVAQIVHRLREALPWQHTDPPETD